MTVVTYTPRGPGCTVSLVTSETIELVVVRAGLDDRAPAADGHEDLRDNLALVARLQAYAANELAYRRLRSPEKRKSHKEAAKQARRDAVAIAEMITRAECRTISGWCSGCFEYTDHRHVRGNGRSKRKFLCLKCGTPTTKCGVPGCRHLAIVNPRALLNVRYCAQHRHEVPSFEKLNTRLTTLADCEQWLCFESRNAARITMVAGGTIGAAAAIAPLAFFAAPVIGAALGSSTLLGEGSPALPPQATDWRCSAGGPSPPEDWAWPAAPLW